VTERPFDAVIVGAGTCGATLARELARRNQKVLLLEQGSSRPIKDTIAGMLAVGRTFPVGEQLQALAAEAVGGSNTMFLGVCELPTQETFASLGIDLSEDLAQIRRELPIAELPDEFLQPQSRLVRDAAREMGYHFKKHLMLIDQSKCVSGGYSHEAKWQARTYIDEALSRGAILKSGAVVQKVIVENGRAVGVEYQQKRRLLPGRLTRAYGKRVILSAGAFATPKLLMACGLKNIGNRGFFCKPSSMVYGLVPRLKGKEAFLGQLNADLGNGVCLGDATMHASLFRLFMLGNLRWRHIFAHARTIAVGVQVNDVMSGEILPDGRYHKQLTAEELGKLQAAKEIACSILEKAGATRIFDTRLAAGIPGGAVRVHEHVDENLQTQISGLYVCDHSLMSDVKITASITLICLAKRLARHLTPPVRCVRPCAERTAAHA
jgi:GMC oxidoreductase